jgi:hypothetical protein
VPASLIAYASDRHSQNGEDGILAEIFRRLGIETGWYVEFGAWDGKHLSNTYALLEAGWSGVAIEGDLARFGDLQATAAEAQGRLHVIHAFVGASGPDSLEALLSATPLPKQFELLSIDIDSYDYWVWESVIEYDPMIVIVEINSSFPVHQDFVQPPGPEAGGTSFASMLQLGQRKGYTLLCHTGNMFFARNDVVDRLGLPQAELANPDSLFDDKWVPR